MIGRQKEPWVAVEMKTHALPPTINLHSLSPCNFQCGFCYAGFATANRSRIPQRELHEIIRQIATAPKSDGGSARKITFAGGEPLLSPTLHEDIAQAHRMGLVTSLVTNGSLLTTDQIHRLAPILDWLTISVDSLEDETNRRIGRAARGVTVPAADHLAKIHLAQDLGIRVKLNTVVNAANATEDFSAFIRQARPIRWKLFQATRITGENGADFDRWRITKDTFCAFVTRHESLRHHGIVLVPETQDDIYGSYAMIGPNGCFFDNSCGEYRYSQPIARVGIEAAWAEITFSQERFLARKGDYDFDTGLNRNAEVQR